jgi:anti-sigma factor RsiW
MSVLCNLFNQYRDEMLTPEETIRFESHLAECSRCQHRLCLLSNMVDAIRKQDMPVLKDSPGKIAARAYEQGRSWDALLLSWLKPLPVWSFAALLIGIAFLWVAPSVQQPASAANYEDVMTSVDQARSAVPDLSDAALENWLEQGGAIQ